MCLITSVFINKYKLFWIAQILVYGENWYRDLVALTGKSSQDTGAAVRVLLSGMNTWSKGDTIKYLFLGILPLPALLCSTSETQCWLPRLPSFPFQYLLSHTPAHQCLLSRNVWMYFTVLLHKKNKGFWVHTEICHGIIFGDTCHQSI